MTGGSSRTAMLAVGLFVAVLASAVAVVYARHESRRLFIELQGQTAVRDQLNVDWGRLQIERSTWASLGRVEQLAGDDLKMHVPDPLAVVIVEP